MNVLFAVGTKSFCILGEEFRYDNPCIHILNLPIPSSEYKWWADYDTEAGRAFEGKIVDYCSGIIVNEFAGLSKIEVKNRQA